MCIRDRLWFPYIPFGKLTIIQGNPGEGKTYFATVSYTHLAELHSQSAEENCMTENVASLRSVKVATPPCAAKAAIPCGLAVRKRF